jgi:cytidine deaminase
MHEIPWDALKRAARAAQKNAYAPYSRFPVGAALLTKSGTLVSGCNVENASYGATICAERAALAAAVAVGERELRALVIASGASSPTPPCGICRQCLSELAPNLEIRSYADDESSAEYSLHELLPAAFSAEQLD